MGQQRRTEPPELGSMVGRVMRSLARQSAEGDLEAMRQLSNLADEAVSCLGDAARGAHAFGYSWTDVGDTLGVTRQSARERFRTGSS